MYWQDERRTPRVEDEAERAARVKEYRTLGGEACDYIAAAEYHRALTTLREAIELMPEQPDAYHSMADALLASDDDEAACRYFLRAERR